MGPRTAVILSTYNRPHVLELVLASLELQSDQEFEVVVADDGSGAETCAVVEAALQRGRLRIRHTWHEDLGFRKSRILNEAVRGTTAELLVFLDQDAVTHRDWLAWHRRKFAPGRFCPGGFVALTEEQSHGLDVAAVRAGRHETLPTLRQRLELKNRHWRNLLYIATLRKDRPRFVGMNFSVSRELYERVNGYDEAYEGWGKEDSDLRTRMRLAGAPARCLWDRAVVYHVWHPERSRADLPRNQARYEAVRSRRLPWRCAHGLTPVPEHAAR